MTVATTGNKFSYSGDDATTAFAFSKFFYEDADLRVILRDASDVETVQTIVTHYSVTGAGVGGGGTVTMVTPPATGETLVIVRRTVQHQETDYVTNGGFSALSHEDALDKLTLIVQDLEERVDRALKLRETTSTAEQTLPEPEDTKVIGWDGATIANLTFAAATGAVDLTTDQTITSIKNNTSQPSFSAFLSATASNVTGTTATGNYVVVFDTEIWDQGSGYDHATGIFTAPVTGKYQLNTMVQLSGITAAADSLAVRIITSNRPYTASLAIANDMPQTISVPLSVLADMDAGDTAFVNCIVIEEASDVVDVMGDASTVFTNFSGWMQG